MRTIATTLVAILAMALGASACQSAAPPAGGLGQETKKSLPTPPAGGLGQETKKSLPTPPAGGLGQRDQKSLRTAIVVAAVEACANRSGVPFIGRGSSTRHGDCFALRAIKKALADCGLNGLSPRNDSCGTLGLRRLLSISINFGVHGGNDVTILALLAKDCADGKGFCDAMQTVQTLVDCGLKAETPDACDQVIAEAEAQWQAQDGDND